MKRVLVVYSTVSGCTATIAHRIGVDLIAYGARPRVASVDECFDLDPSYDAVVIGSGVRVGKWHREAREWVQRNAAALAHIPVAAFSVGLRGIDAQGTMNEASVRSDVTRMVEAAGVKNPVGVIGLPGWKRPEGFSTMERMGLAVYPLADGDYRNWDLTDRWVNKVATLLTGTQPLVARGLPIEGVRFRSQVIQLHRQNEMQSRAWEERRA